MLLHRVRCRPLFAAVALTAVLALPQATTAAPSQAVDTEIPGVALVPLQTRDRRIVDLEGRDVLLRGANVNSLGEYWQGVPELPATVPVTEADWDEMAARGFSVIRLLISWSKVEPTRGAIDQTYLDQVEAMVDNAASHGMYSVLDMHQDAYSATIFTTDPAECPSGTQPAKGWDGAPAWATITDGLSTCLTTGDRNSSPAVIAAWNHFYDNTDGIQDRFVASWAAVAERFAGRAEVAGYDLLNEPEVSRPAADLQGRYDELMADTIGAIRAAEADAAFDHIVFVEPAIPAGDLSRGIVIPSPAALGGDVANVSASVHNYMESITSQLTLEAMNGLIEQITADLGVPNWGGEYGFWNTEPSTLATARRYAADEDARRWGGAWWQWRQSCGDPHSVQWRDGAVVSHTGTEVHLNRLGCPDNTDLGPNEDFLNILGRGYPRAAPGTLTELRSDTDTGWLKVRATAPTTGGTLVVWTPTADDAEHQIHLDGLTDLVQHEVPGGRILTATVARTGTYTLWVGEPDDDGATPVDPPVGPSPVTPATPAPGATPVRGRPAYTG